MINLKYLNKIKNSCSLYYFLLFNTFKKNLFLLTIVLDGRFLVELNLKIIKTNKNNKNNFKK